MLDEKDLQAIAQMIKESERHTDEKLSAMESRLDAKMEQRITDAQSEIMRGVAVLMEAKFDPQFNLLAEGQQTIRELLPPQEDWEIMDTRMSALEAMVKKLNREVAQLKKAQ